MKKYLIEYNYNAKIEVEVTGDFADEGEALSAGRAIAEDADITEFTLSGELPSRIIEVNEL